MGGAPQRDTVGVRGWGHAGRCQDCKVPKALTKGNRVRP